MTRHRKLPAGSLGRARPRLTPTSKLRRAIGRKMESRNDGKSWNPEKLFPSGPPPGIRSYSSSPGSQGFLRFAVFVVVFVLIAVLLLTRSYCVFIVNSLLVIFHHLSLTVFLRCVWYVPAAICGGGRSCHERQ